MLSRRTEIWDSGARKRRVLLFCAPQSQSSARCANINFFSSPFLFFFFFDSRHGIYPEKGEVFVVSNISHVDKERNRMIVSVSVYEAQGSVSVYEAQGSVSVYEA